ncbi:MAG: hypothetical protein MUO97_03430 [Dehalococcoidia bacterium]|nr:hypothetical protein [Dehalococcoidia bacterium]
MSLFEIIGAAVALAGAVICASGLIRLILAAQRSPFHTDIAPAKGSAAHGVLYAFTLGMAPWAKESARLHWVAYIRGILFHLTIFLGVALLVASPWLPQIPSQARLSIAAILEIGAVLVLSGFWIRWREPALRQLSTPDDYASLGLVTLFLVLGGLAAAVTELLPAFWIISGITLAYTPFSKLRHFIYFFYTRIYFGLVFGRRGLLE